MEGEPLLFHRVRLAQVEVELAGVVAGSESERVGQTKHGDILEFRGSPDAPQAQATRLADHLAQQLLAEPLAAIILVDKHGDLAGAVFGAEHRMPNHSVFDERDKIRIGSFCLSGCFS